MKKDLSVSPTCHSASLTHAASDPGFNYYGRWHLEQQAITINSGAMVEFAYTGNSCTLVFDVEQFTHFPGVLVQVDEGEILKTFLSAETNTVTVTPTYNAASEGTPPFAGVAGKNHLVRFWAISHSLYQTDAEGQQWSTLVGACKFLGADLNGGTLIALPYNSWQIEFLGDSLTQGLRLLYTASDVDHVEPDIRNQMPHLNWPQLVANMLGMKPIVTGFGGQALSGAGTCGAPPAPLAFPLVYDGVPWQPDVEPLCVVIYHGTNGDITAPLFQSLYVSYLTTVRSAYPTAAIYAVCPHNQTRYAEAIEQAVESMADPAIRFLDYSTDVISASETCDGCHLNPGGAIKLATRFANDLADM